MRDFRGRVAVITGAAEGIGRAIALEAARRGMALALADVNARELAQVSAQCAAAGVATLAETVDVSHAQQMQQFADVAFERLGNVHLLVNNAGVGIAKPAWDTSESDWRWVMGVNLYGVTNSLRSFVPRMLQRGDEGHIVNVASIAGLLSEPGLAAYNASKFAVLTVSEGLHHDLTLRHARIKTSVLCPGWVKTRIAEAERHRDPSDRTDPARLDAQAQRSGRAVREAVETGMSPEQVAEIMFAAIERDEFYIFTHPQTLEGVRIRMQDILTGRDPTLLPF